MINPIITDENPAAMTPAPAREVKPPAKLKQRAWRLNTGQLRINFKPCIFPRLQALAERL